MQSKKWTALETAALKSFHQDKYTDEQIGKKMGRTADAIREKRSKIGAVKFKKEPYKQTNPRAYTKNGRAKLLNGQPIPMFPTEMGKITNGIAKEIKPTELDELTAGTTIQKTIHTDVGIPGTINIYNHDGEADFTITGLSPRNAINILSKIISKLI